MLHWVETLRSAFREGEFLREIPPNLNISETALPFPLDWHHLVLEVKELGL